jgi:hypothetical protein
MGLSSRMSTKECKRAAVQRLEQRVSIDEVTRALEVNPNVLRGLGPSGSWCRRSAAGGPCSCGRLFSVDALWASYGV